MLRWSFILVGFAAVFVSAEHNDIRLEDKWVKVIDKGGSQHLQGNHSWYIVSPSGGKVKLYCTDFRLSMGSDEEASCFHSRLLLDDGKSKSRFCGFQRDFHIVGNTSRLTIDFLTSDFGGGSIECYAKAVRYPRNNEKIDLTPRDGIRVIKFPDVTGLDSDKAWKIRSVSNGKISLQCTKRMEGPLDSGVCAKDILTIDSGDGPKVECGYEKVKLVARGTEMSIRMETFPGTTGSISCLVQIITGPNLNEADNAKYDVEDSSEFGLSPGPKGTTCPCGTANRDSGRIINGTEVKFVSKYPFMVSMQFPGGGHFCGASIISPIHILTAAHCVSDQWTKDEPVPAELKPKVGIHNVWEDAAHGQSQILDVKEVHIPKEWFAVKGSLAGDIAILVLESPIKFSRWVSPVCLTPTMPKIYNKFIKAMGWGRTENGSTDTLREANVQVLDPVLCNNNNREVCFKTGPSTSCFGDSGGPYVYVDPETNRYTQVGVTSYVLDKCKGPFFIGTSTIHWFDWIQGILSATGGQKICQKL